jgi:hypothetical protein
MRRYVIDIPLTPGRIGSGITYFFCDKGRLYLDDDRDEPTLFEFTQAITHCSNLPDIASRVSRHCAADSLNYRVQSIEPMALVNGGVNAYGLRLIIAPTVGLGSLCIL